MSVATVEKHEPLEGYFASVLLGMMLSAWLAASLAEVLPFEMTGLERQSWRQCIGAAIFMAIAFCNPVGVLVRKQSNFAASCLRFVLGALSGAVLQSFVFAPIAGGQMSYFLVLFSAGLVFPIVIAFSRLNAILEKNGTNLGDALGRQVLRVTSWPDRYLFTSLMAACFVMFWLYVPNWMHVTAVLGFGLVFALLFAVWGTWREKRRNARQVADYDAWLALEDEIETVARTTAEVARIELLRLMRNFLPGAIMFGGMTRLSVEILKKLFPASEINLTVPADAFVSAAMIAASGLGLVLFGMLAVSVMSIGMIEGLSRLFRWNAYDTKDARYRLMRMFFVHPIALGREEEEF